MAPRPVTQGGSKIGSNTAQRRRSSASFIPRHTNHPRNTQRSSSLSSRNFTDAFTQNDRNRNNRNPGTGFCRFCTIQDNDPRTVYSGSWLLRGTTFNTTHSTTQEGASVSLRFKGQKIMVLGTVPVSNSTVKPPKAKYTISGRDPVQSTLPMANTEIAGQSFFHATGLEEEELTLTIEIVEAQAPYTLDAFFVTPHNFGGNNSDADDRADEPQPSSSLPPTSTTLSTAEFTPIPTPDPYTDETSRLPTKEAPTNLVPVLSGLVGGLLAVIVIGMVLFFVRKKRRANNPNVPLFWKNWHWKSSPRPETVYTSWTTSESIQRDEPSWLQRGSSAFTRSEGPPSDLRVSTIDQRFSLPPQPPLPTLSRFNL